MPSHPVPITSERVKQLESESAEESKLNDVLVLCLEVAATQLTSGRILRAVAGETNPGFGFLIQPQYEQDKDVLDFKLCLDALKSKNKRLADITARLLDLRLSSLEPGLDERIASLNISPPKISAEPGVAYRWDNPGGGTGYHPDIGFWCGQWKFEQEPGFEPRGFDNIEALKDHLRGVEIASPWISITHIPGQMLEILDRKSRNDAHQVHIIDFRKLKLLNPHMKTTRDLAMGVERFHSKTNPGGPKAISYHHWLAQQWIPACCILGSLTVKAFRRILLENEIRNSKPSTERNIQMLIMYKVPDDERGKNFGKDFVNSKLLPLNMWQTYFAAAEVGTQ